MKRNRKTIKRKEHDKTQNGKLENRSREEEQYKNNREKLEAVEAEEKLGQEASEKNREEWTEETGLRKVKMLMREKKTRTTIIQFSI